MMSNVRAFKEIPHLNTRDDKLVARCLNDLYLGEVKVMSPSKAGNSNVFSCAIVCDAYLHDFNSQVLDIYSKPIKVSSIYPSSSELPFLFIVVNSKQFL